MNFLKFIKKYNSASGESEVFENSPSFIAGGASEQKVVDPSSLKTSGDPLQSENSSQLTLGVQETALTNALGLPCAEANNFDYDVSVIIPVFNCEEFIEQCVRSVLELQDCRVEVIAINDESPDGALLILQRLAADFSNLIIVDQENRGGASTLNRGLDMARGEFVAFLDSDDWMAPHALDLLLFRARSDKSQVAVGCVEKYIGGSFTDVYDTRFISSSFVWDVTRHFNKDCLYDTFYTGKIFLKSHLSKYHIRFCSDLLYADRTFVSLATLSSVRVSYSSATTAYWRKRADGASITDQKADPDRIIDKMLGFVELLADPIVKARKEAETEIAEQAFHRLFWSLKYTDDPCFAEGFAEAAFALASQYPQYLSLKRLSALNKRIVSQCLKYKSQYLFVFCPKIMQAVSEHKARKVSISVLYKVIINIPFEGERREPDELPKVLKSPNVFLFESNFGKQYGGQPRYLYEALLRAREGFTAIWVYSSNRGSFKKIPAPRKGRLIQVKRGSPEYSYWLKRARYWINNIRFPSAEKPEGTVYVQTWHGTPLKRLGLDINVTGPEVDARESFLKEAGMWDYLLAQNDFAKDVFQRAFAVKCPIIASGYPANDILVDLEKREKVAAFIRKKYGIPKDKKIVTYAPTWRDNGRVGAQWLFTNRIRLDFFKLREQLGQDYVLVVRLHHLMAKNLKTDGLEGFLFDASREPDVNRLLCATDVLVTDYSSIFFDYACTGKPILFYMFDRDAYETELRGLYLDPDEDLPGPVFETEHDLIQGIKSVDRLNASFAGKYSRFKKRFNSGDDGNVSNRVINQIFNERTTATLLSSRRKARHAKVESPEEELLRTGWDSSDYIFEITVLLLGDGKKDSIQNALDAHQPLLKLHSQIVAIKSGNWEPPESWKSMLSEGRLKLIDSNQAPFGIIDLTPVIAAADGRFITVQGTEKIFKVDSLLRVISQCKDAEASIFIACHEAIDGRFPIDVARIKERTVVSQLDAERVTLAQGIELDSIFFLKAQLRLWGLVGEKQLMVNDLGRVLSALLLKVPRVLITPVAVSYAASCGIREPKSSSLERDLDLLSYLDPSMEDSAKKLFRVIIDRILLKGPEVSSNEVYSNLRLLAAKYPAALRFPVLSGGTADLFRTIMPSLEDNPLPKGEIQASPSSFERNMKRKSVKGNMKRKPVNQLVISGEQSILRLTARAGVQSLPASIEVAISSNTFLILHNGVVGSRKDIYQLVSQAIALPSALTVVVVCLEIFIPKIKDFFVKSELPTFQTDKLRFVSTGSSDHFTWLSHAGSILVNGFVDKYSRPLLEGRKGEGQQSIIQTAFSYLDGNPYLEGIEITKGTLVEESEVWTHVGVDHSSCAVTEALNVLNIKVDEVTSGVGEGIDLRKPLAALIDDGRKQNKLGLQQQTIGLFLRCNPDGVPHFECDASTVRNGLEDWEVLINYIKSPNIPSIVRGGDFEKGARQGFDGLIAINDMLHTDLLSYLDVIVSDDAWVLMTAAQLGKACIMLSKTLPGPEFEKSIISSPIVARNLMEVASKITTAKLPENIASPINAGDHCFGVLPHWSEVFKRG